MKKICVVTTTRAEYGLLRNVIKIIDKDPSLELCLIVTGTHLSSEFGMTVNEIVDDNVAIAQKIDIMMSSNDVVGVTKTMAMASFSFSEMFERETPDFLIVLGDRYELLPICSSALIAQIPIGHISGGEMTQGVIDDAVRHSVTKMSYLHFPACETYRQRIIQLGETPNRVFNYGDVGVELVKNMDIMPKEELAHQIDFDLSTPYMCVTFHPATLDRQSAEKQIDELLAAVKNFSDYKFIFTKANADVSGKEINKKIDDFVAKNENCVAFTSLGVKRYLASVAHCKAVIGNSSSGIVEAPSLCVPTVNIGDRQKGRLQANSIINCEPVKADIQKSIEYVMSDEVQQKAKKTVNPYGSGDTSISIVKTIKYYLENDKIDLKKQFYDIDMTEHNL